MSVGVPPTYKNRPTGARRMRNGVHKHIINEPYLNPHLNDFDLNFLVKSMRTIRQ